MRIDPVCKANLNEAEENNTATAYKGKTYYFCCSSCREEFLKNPKQYVCNSWWQRFLQRLEKTNAEEYGSKGPSCH